MIQSVLIVGAAGRTGHQAVCIALALDLRVTALVRRPEALATLAKKIAIVEGDVLDESIVMPTMEGHDAVILAFGPSEASPPMLCSNGTRNIVNAMEVLRVPRLVAVTGAMSGHPRDHVSPVFRVMMAMQPRAALEDRQLQESRIIESDLDWTIVRPPKLTDDAPRGTWREGTDIDLTSSASIARADLADFIVRELEDTKYLRRAVTIAY